MANTQGVFDKDLVTASGLSWCKGGKVEIGLTNAVAQILCEKHNSALSDFDSAASDLSHFLLEQVRRNPEGKAHFSVNGYLTGSRQYAPQWNRMVVLEAKDGRSGLAVQFSVSRLLSSQNSISDRA